MVVLGAGAAGLSAAWRLRREGVVPRVLEAGKTPGGNARWGELSGVTRYPWGAHYLRVPTADHPALERFLEEVELIRGRDAQGRPDWDTRAVCVGPHERLFEGGVWRENLFPPPRSGTPQDQEEMHRFERLVDLLSKLRGTDGRRAFAIPVERSSRDAELVALDGLAFATWFEQQGFESKALRWLLDYSVRDDYGCTLETTSAWAGLHYFCARKSDDETREQVLAWPEGNGRLIQLLLRAAGEQPVEPRALCFKVDPGARPGLPSEALVYLGDKDRVVRIRAQHLIWAGPQFILQHLLPAPSPAAKAFGYAPWLVANLTLRRDPEGVGAGIAWDNVFYGADSLGYVVANRERAPGDPLVVTWYQPFSGADPRAERERLLGLDHARIVDLVCDDVFAVHPRLRGELVAVDAWRWGHAMIRPVQGFIWGDRLAALERQDALLCAHSDLSGISIFEEAFYRGVLAGEEVLRRKGATFQSLIG
ncbi:MAG: NAD(P)-binding protein [Planctomycetota bacterium]